MYGKINKEITLRLERIKNGRKNELRNNFTLGKNHICKEKLIKKHFMVGNNHICKEKLIKKHFTVGKNHICKEKLIK